MLDRYNRDISYLRISVTDRCNLRCRYCMPEEGVQLMSHNDILSFEEICETAKKAVGFGIKRIRLTGGEPLVRKNIVALVKMLKAIDGIEEVSMTTNGILLSRYADDLANAGLTRINISLDTVDAEKFKWLTRGGDLNQVFEGIKAAKKANLHPIKLNCVVRDSSDEPDAKAVKTFAKNNHLQVRFIHQMDMATGSFSQVEGGEGGNCGSCNRLRLTADGHIKPCLFNPQKFSIKQGIEEAFSNAINNKPLSGTHDKSSKFYQIGG